MKTLYTDSRTLLRWTTTALLAALLWAPLVSAQPARRGPAVRPAPVAPVLDAAELQMPEIDIDRDGDALRDEIRPRPIDTDIADTALIFTNLTPNHVYVTCIARDQSGTLIGRTRTRLPSRGLRYVRASDFSDGRDFVGHAECKSNGQAVATAVLFGAEITDLSATSRRRGRGMHHRFPVIATY